VPPPAAEPLVDIADIRAAAERLRGVALRTPLMRLPTDGQAIVYVKPESLQPTGAFKLRGAYNAIAQLTPDEMGRGVVTHSSGNHGQAVAYVARLFGIRAVIVMPQNAPRVKVERVRSFGAEIAFVEPTGEARSRRAAELVERDGLLLVPAANDRRVIAGQGTVGLEIVEQLAELDGDLAELDGDKPERNDDQPSELTVLAPIGQGGLAAGVGTAVKALRPDARMIGVEPAFAADAHESLGRGEIVSWPSDLVQRTLADGLRMEAVTPIPFAHLQRMVDEVALVDEEEIVQAVGRAAYELRLVLEPSGAASLAAVDRWARAGSTTVAVLSGGNVDTDLYIDLVRRYHRA
jgi:threo-3-hydroxy-L-aspartate ammonia-lyase